MLACHEGIADDENSAAVAAVPSVRHVYNSLPRSTEWCDSCYVHGILIVTDGFGQCI
jgi:hypothetical protein